MDFYDYLGLLARVEKREETTVGTAKDDLVVDCRPSLEDPNILQRQNRVACLAQPYEACRFCPNTTFDLVFNIAKEQRYEQVSCPRWTSPASRLMGQDPEGYVSVEAATCAEAPFEFCPSCPSKRNVERTGADKATSGWYGRWHRLQRADQEDEDG